MSVVDGTSTPVSPVTFRERPIIVDGTSILVSEAGAGKPLVFVSRQETTSNPLAVILATSFHVIVLKDGEIERSPRSSQPGRLDSILSALDLESCNLVSEQTGAGAALHVMADQPGKINRLVMLEPEVFDNNGLFTSVDLSEKIKNVTDQSMALFGTDAGGASAATASACRLHIPNCHLVYIYDAANITSERPEAAASVIADFLNRGEGFLVSDRDGRIHP